MNVLVIGSGGREHAIVQALVKSPLHSRCFVAPGNGGMASLATCVPIAVTDFDALVHFAKQEAINYVVVAPDDPLVLGLVDRFNAEGIPCFGPDQKAAQIEGSKVFAKALMEKYKIPSASYRAFTSLPEALAYIETQTFPLVIKADGLALGKGVIIAERLEEAQQALCDMLEGNKFGKSGHRVVIEDFLVGPEVSVLCFTDGTRFAPMVSSMDHKRVGDGDCGLNTGGMGTIAPNPYYTAEVHERCCREIFEPTLRAMRAEGCPFKGCLYFGLMLCPDGPKVIEYNCRFGDPETQVVLPLLESDLLEVMLACTQERLEPSQVRFSQDSACCVILASKGYPEAYEKGFPIDFQNGVEAHCVMAGVALQDGTLHTSGGRVLGVTAVAASLPEAIQDAYARVNQVHFEGAYCRKDIGQRALAALEVQHG